MIFHAEETLWTSSILKSDIGEQGRYSSKPDHWHRNESWLRNLRHRYFHFSARMSAGHDPRIVNGKRTRKIYNNG